MHSQRGTAKKQGKRLGIKNGWQFRSRKCLGRNTKGGARQMAKCTWIYGRAGCCEANRCLQCKNKRVFPLSGNVQIPEFIAEIAKGELRKP